MDNLTSDQDLNTSMEYMKFCIHVIDKEIKRFNLDFTVYQSFVTQLPGILDVNFDIAYNRCAFMYKYFLSNISFFKDCMNKFLLDYPEFKNLVSNWKADSNIRLCSLSCGPGLDYLSFILALSDHISPPSFKITILSKHGAWRNTVSIVADALQEGIISKNGIGELNFKNFEVVQTNILVSIPAKGLEALRQSSVILMVKTLNLTSPGTNEEEIIKTKLVEIISSLKPEATVFFIDTKPSLALFLEVLPKFDGKFLFKPEHLSFRVPVSFSEEFRERNGCLPVVCSRGAFFVWQKLSSLEPGPNFNSSFINPPIDVKEISQNSLEKFASGNEDILRITKSLKDLTLPHNQSLQPNSVESILSNSHTSDNNQSLQPSVSDIREMVSAMNSFVDSSKQSEINKSASSQNLVTTQSVQELSLVNFDEKSCSSHSLKKWSSIDNSFFQSSSKGISFLEESNLVQNSLYSSTIEETHQHNATEKNINENKEKINVFKNNQALKPSLNSKATQTEFPQSVTNSNAVKGLTERVKQLVSSLENEAQKNSLDGHVSKHMHESPNKSTNYSSCSANCNNSDVDIKPQCCNNGYQIEKENPMSCNYIQMNHTHCCVARHMMCRCEMYCCQSCVHRCNMNSYRLFCESNIASTQPQIVIPLQNVSDDILLKIISAAKSTSKPQ